MGSIPSQRTESSGDKSSSALRFRLRTVFAIVAVIAVILMIARYNRGKYGAGWTAIREGSSSSHFGDLYLSAAEALNEWLAENGFHPAETPKLRAVTHLPEGTWLCKQAGDGTPIYVDIIAQPQHFRVSVQYAIMAWPFQSTESRRRDISRECGSVSDAIDEWWIDFKEQYLNRIRSQQRPR